MKTKILSILMIGMFAIIFVSFPSCNKDNNDISITEDSNESADLKKKQKERPFKGTVVFAQTGEFEDCLTCPYTPTTYPFGDFSKFNGTGNLTHMGNVTAESMPCFTYIFNESFQVIGYTVHEQCNIFTAANGDELYSYANEYDNYYDPECNCFYGEGNGSFSGGTGRFEGASGDVTFTVTQDAETNVTTTVIDGVIVY